ncbi:hypothetical protein [Nocardia macrotermitis]|uniref:Uncharacterized protein n=1 Tax=Nocardia macrotermitis TaxID=2585198 RepID=A0A7K0CYS9_9NOCA|nr:hypothetical protein [Nocardia macrotermitis]MQY18578.1 hypothetical protein [Nocardia macrotermitis]
MGFGDWFNTLTGHQFDSSVKPTQSEKDAATKGDAGRSAANSVSNTLGQNYHGEYLPQTVAQLMENFDGMSHDEIIKYQNSINVQSLNTSVDGWTNIAKDLGSKCDLFKNAIEGQLNNGWSGATAEAAKTTVRNFAEDMSSLTNAANMVASKINDATVTLTQVKNQIPGKQSSTNSSLLGIVTNVLSPGSVVAHVMTDHGRSSNAQNAARDVMNHVYKQYVPEANTQVPKMPGVSQTDKNAGATGPSGPSQSSTGPNTYNSTGHSYGSGTSTGTSTSNGTSTNPTSTGTSYNSYNSTGTSTSPSSLNLPDATSGLSSSYSPTSTAGYSPSGSGTAGTTGGGGYNSSGGGLGSSIPGTTAGTNTATAANASAAKNNSLNGLGGMPHGGKKDGEGDSEHKTPDYLRGVYEELTGPDPKLLPGGVIGGDYTE